MQLVHAINSIWVHNGLDLRIVQYRVLPTGLHEGMVEYIPSDPLSAILLAYNNSICAYFRSLSALAVDHRVTFEEFDTLPIAASLIDNYVRSCAGWAAITFVLGIGDRHLENLLLTPDGRLFHVDYAFLFGNDPKPLPPPMKLCREMVEAMGGVTGESFLRFKGLCFTAYLLLRRNAGLLLALITLMHDSGAIDPENEPAKAVAHVHDKLALEKSDEEALRAFEQLIDESVNALFPQVMETIHKWAQYWRK